MALWTGLGSSESALRGNSCDAEVWEEGAVLVLEVLDCLELSESMFEISTGSPISCGGISFGGSELIILRDFKA